MTEQDRDQDLVAAALASAPPPGVSPGFLARVNARIDAERDNGWFAILDFKVWTLRLAPAAAAVALIAVLWPANSRSTTSSSTSTASTSSFTPASATDWQNDVNANALLEAALAGTTNAR